MNQRLDALQRAEAEALDRYWEAGTRAATVGDIRTMMAEVRAWEAATLAMTRRSQYERNLNWEHKPNPYGWENA